jgi:hypothetical protein
LLDLQHGLPVQVRDSLYKGTNAALASAGAAPQSIVNLDYQTALRKMRVCYFFFFLNYFLFPLGRRNYGDASVHGFERCNQECYCYSC